jgi:amino acid transporter
MQVIYVSAELSAPDRQLPLAINSAIPTIILCFIAVNASYYILLPWDVISTTDSVAVVSVEIVSRVVRWLTYTKTAIMHLLPFLFGILAAVLICLVIAGALLGNSFVASRMAVAAAKVGWLPSLFAIIGRTGFSTASNANDESSSSDAPRNALLLSTSLSALYILLGSFRALLTFNGLGEYSFFFLAVIGALVLRYRKPELPRPYKTTLSNPILFALVSGFIVVRGAIFAPLQAGTLVLVWVLGVGFYFLRLRLRRARED